MIVDNIKDNEADHCPLILAAPFDEVEKLVGYDKAVAIVQILGYGWIYIPSMETLTREHRYEEIIYGYFEKELKPRELAKKFRCSESTVRNYIKQAKRDNIPPEQTRMPN